MIERQLIALIRTAVDSAAGELGLQAEVPTIEVSRPRQKEHGDYATNVALAVGSALSRNPREVADMLVRHFPPNDLVAKVEVAGPGFINFTVTHGWLYRVLEEIDRQGGAFGRVEDGRGSRAQIEFVSANPTGPLHVGQGRNAAIGDSLARVLEAAGWAAEREYYWNDTGTQIELFGASVEARYLASFGVEAEVPEEGYRGAYVDQLAAAIAAEVGDRWVREDPDRRRKAITAEARSRTADAITATLARFGVRFDTWTTEGSLLESGAVERAVRRLLEAGHAYESEGATWFRATEYGDDKDRVLIRRTGEPTYFGKDVAYLLEKVARGFDRLIYVWGADHHGDVKRMKGVAQALGIDPDSVEIFLYQLVNLYRDREPVRMSKRTGDVITLDELLDEVGVDAARYTLLSRSNDTALDFDIELVKSQSLDNPVYYVQYAHARIASLISYAEEQGSALRPLAGVAPEELVHETELDLLRKLADFPEQVRLAAAMRAPYRLTRYAEEAAADFHRFYTECRVVTDDPSLTQARLHLASATRQVIANVLGLLGVSTPESMERLAERP